MTYPTTSTRPVPVSPAPYRGGGKNGKARFPNRPGNGTFGNSGKRSGAAARGSRRDAGESKRVGSLMLSISEWRAESARAWFLDPLEGRRL
jgi:hypothetical protein